MNKIFSKYIECERHIEKYVDTGPCRDKILALTQWIFFLNAEAPMIPAVKCYATKNQKDIRFFLKTQGKDHFALYKLQKSCTVLEVYKGSSVQKLPSYIAQVSGNRVWGVVKRPDFQRLSIDELKSDILRAYRTRLDEMGLRASGSEGNMPMESDQDSPEDTSESKSDQHLKTVPPLTNPVSQDISASEDKSIKHLFQAAGNLIAHECETNPADDLHRQFSIVETRHWGRIESEADILNCLLIQAASYSVLRKTFGVLYAEDIWKLDSAYGTSFFEQNKAPHLGYADWERIVLDWGNQLLEQAGLGNKQNLGELVNALKLAYKNGKTDLSPRKPKSRLVLSLATALPKVQDSILADVQMFFNGLDDLSKRSPGAAYDYATQFSEGIVGMGNALVANFLKEIGLLYYVKVDVHLGDLMDELSLGQKLSDRNQFILSWLVAREADMEPFFIDKILYIGGKYLKQQMRQLFKQHRHTYQVAIAKLLEELPKYSRLV